MLDDGRVVVDGATRDVLADRDTMAAHRLELPYGFDPLVDAAHPRRSVDRMTAYTPPLEDMRFVLQHVVDVAALAELPGYEHADPDTVTGILDEAGRFFAEQFAPLNRIGDLQHSRRNDDGSVTTPDGFPKAYQRYVEAGWPAVPFPPEYGGGGFPWLVGVAMQEVMTAANMALLAVPAADPGRHRHAPALRQRGAAGGLRLRRWSPASGRAR